MDAYIRNIVDDLKAELSRKDQIFIKSLKFDGLHTLHHTLGNHIRNTYGLWERDWIPSKREVVNGILIDASPEHPNQLSMTIIEELWKDLQRINFPTEPGYLKLYIATLDEAPDYMYGTLVAHSVLGASLKFKDDPDYKDWLENSFRKVTIRVSREEFEEIRKLPNVYEGYENTILNGDISCLVTLARQGEVPKVLHNAKLWKPKK